MDTTALRALAIVLIANSHLENLYPFRPLAADGLIGNTLFFLLSGLGLALSPRTGSAPFLQWLRRRLERIYPSVWIAVLVGTVGLHGAWRHWHPSDAARAFLWPTPYMFIGQILLFYPVFYLLKALKSPRMELGLFLGLGAPYAAIAWFCYDLHLLSWIFYFQVMIFGGLLVYRVDRIGRHPGRDGVVLAASLASYVLLKLAMVTGRIPMHVGALHLLTLPILWGLVNIFSADRVRAVLQDARLAAPLQGLAGMTLEIYLVHEFVLHTPPVQALVFPINVAAFWAATLPVAWALRATADRLRRLPITGNGKPLALPTAQVPRQAPSA